MRASEFDRFLQTLPSLSARRRLLSAAALVAAGTLFESVDRLTPVGAAKKKTRRGARRGRVEPASCPAGQTPCPGGPPECQPGEICNLDGCCVACSPVGSPCQFSNDCCGESATCDFNTHLCKSSACVPDCAGKTCGEDGCMGSCGLCPSGQFCNGGVCSDTTPPCPLGSGASRFGTFCSDACAPCGKVAVGKKKKHHRRHKKQIICQANVCSRPEGAPCACLGQAEGDCPNAACASGTCVLKKHGFVCA